MEKTDFETTGEHSEVPVADATATPPSEPIDEMPPTLELQLADSHETAAGYLDGWQRARAELSNVKKRQQKELQGSFERANVELARRILPIMDDLERVVENTPEHVMSDSWYEGITMVMKKFVGTLSAMNIEPIDALGKNFDPNFHDAISMEPSKEFESGTITRVIQQGYKLGDRVVRPALVHVAL